MFKNSITKPNSPFAKKKPLEIVNNANTIKDNNNSIDEVESPEVTTIPSMFKNSITKPNSPFAKKSLSEDNKIDISNEPIKKKLSFGKR